MEMEAADTYYKVARVEDLENGEGKVVFAGVKRVALFRIDDTFYCIQNTCPHAGAHLGLGDLEGCVVSCPRHGWNFDVTTGECKTDGRYRARRYQVKIEDGDIYVALPDKSAIR